MIRNIVAVVVAFVIGGVFVFGIEAIGHQVFPLPAGMDKNNMEQVAAYVKTAPLGALLFVLLAQSSGSFMGGLVTWILGGSRQTILALIYGVLALTMAAITVSLIKHPVWMTALALFLPIPLSLLGSKLGQLVWPAKPPSPR